jgi:hypothetical protein
VSRRRIERGTLIGVVTTLLAGPSLASAQGGPVLRDLTAVIALQGQPCGQVVSAARQGDRDYVATCKDGNRYRVFTNPEGRVVVQKL